VHLIRNAWVPDGDFLNREAAREVLGIRGSGPTVGWVGRIGHEKGCDLAVRALADLPGVRLSIVGDGARRGDLETLASEVEVADRITWHGVVRRADLLLRGFDVLLLSSRTEGTPIIILEALAAGVPIVATRVGGVPNILQHEKDAILVPPEDPSALARAVQVCLSDTASSLRRVENGRVTVESEFGIERWVRRHEEVYDRAMGKGGA
jgi:glycosyltransferase involved in cell wall biosynthesis